MNVIGYSARSAACGFAWNPEVLIVLSTLTMFVLGYAGWHRLTSQTPKLVDRATRRWPRSSAVSPFLAQLGLLHQGRRESLQRG
jgi:hypothetical protein